MDHYTVLRCHVSALERWFKDHPNDRSSVDISEFSISPLLSEAFKRVDPHRYVLLASDGCVHLLSSTNAPVPAEFKHKRYMKSNPRSNIKDVVQVLYNLLGVSVVSGASDVAGFIRLLNFFISFQIENEEMVNLNVCSEWFQAIRRQFLQGPPFEAQEVWKSKYRNPAIKGLYDSVAKQEQIDTLSSFVDKQATILFSMNSESLDAQLEAIRSSASSVRALVEEKSGEIEALKKLLARYDEELEEFSIVLGDLHGKVEKLQPEKVILKVEAVEVKEAPVEVEVKEAVEVEVKEAVAEVVQEEVKEAPAEIEVAQEAVQEAQVEVKESVVEVVQEAPAEVKEAVVEVVQEALVEAEAVQEAAPVEVEVAKEAVVEVAQEAVQEAVAEIAQQAAQVEAEAVPDVAKEAPVEAVQEAVAEVAQEAAPAAAEPVPEAVQEAAPVEAEAVPEAVQEAAPAAAEAVQEAVQEVAQEAALAAAEAVQEAAPVEAATVQEDVPEAVQEVVQEAAPAAEAVQAEAEAVQEVPEAEAAPEIVEPEAPSLVEAEIEEESEEEPDGDDDIELSRIGAHFVIKGTNVVVSIQDGSAVGYLDAARVLHKEESEEVKKACETYGLLFS